MDDKVTRVRIKLGAEATADKCGVFYDDVKSHDVNEAQLVSLLDTAELARWKTYPGDGAQIGRRLYDLLNGDGGRLKSTIDEAVGNGKTLHIYLDTGPVLSVLPFELINDGGRFLLLDTKIHLMRLVRADGWHANPQPENRPLKMVFMASSPTDLGADSVLRYEDEEEHILKATESYPVDIMFEDSGSVAGIKNAIYEFGGCDVVHITGHAGVYENAGPVFFMEKETGFTDYITPDALWKALKTRRPRMLFLSGCETGKSCDIGNCPGDSVAAPPAKAESFAYRMVEMGIPVVLGWGLPVSDAGASIFAEELYGMLAEGLSIYEAIASGRRKVADRYHPWPLLRVFTDGTPLTPITGEHQIRRHTARAAAVKYLEGMAVKVLTEGFIGRRREVQRGIRAITGDSGKYGAVIHGTAGNGKSCLAGKLITRFTQNAGKELVAIHGEATEAKIVGELVSLFDKRGKEEAVDILKSPEKQYEAKIKALFRGPFKEVPVIIYFDDFEQNLEPFEADSGQAGMTYGGGYTIKDTAIGAVRPFMEAVEWAQHKTVVLITSRYPFKLQWNGKDLATKLEHIPLMAFKEADLDKKIAGLEFLAASKHKTMYLQYAGKEGGNPRLLEWFDKLAETEYVANYDLVALEDAINGKSEDFIQEYLAGVITRGAGTDFEGFLRRAAVYRIPVADGAFAAFGTHYKTHLERGVALTLLEEEKLGDGNCFYWVTPVIRQRQWDALDGGEKTAMHQAAFTWFDGEIDKSQRLEPKLLGEAVHHGLESGNVGRICLHAIKLGNYLRDLVRYNDAIFLWEAVADKITDDMVEEAKAGKYEYVSSLFVNYGFDLKTMGRYELAVGYFEKALVIVLATLGDKHPAVARTYNNIGEVWYYLVQFERAIEYFEKALVIDLAAFGDKHPDTAIDYNNIGNVWLALGQYKRAIEYFEKALAIDLTALGDMHPEVATRYNNIGEAWRVLDQYERAIEYFEKALAIDLTALGDKHPNVAIKYNNIGVAWYNLGQDDRAIGYYEKALAIDLVALGDKHPNVAIRYNNIGDAWDSLGQYDRAIGYYEKALTIRTAVLGEAHPHTQTVKRNLEGAQAALDESKKSR